MKTKQDTEIPLSLAPTEISPNKIGLHPRNLHRARYDFAALVKDCPELSQFLSTNRFNEESIDFANPEAVKTLNKAILKHFYSISDWDIPDDYLCPPIPGRADYLHQMADLLAESNSSAPLRVLDIGVGANCIYPLLGHSLYGWHFVGTDIDPVALASAEKILDKNPTFKKAIEFRHQTSADLILKGVVKPDEVFAFTMCNPPFHRSLREAREGSRRKWRNLNKKQEIRKPSPTLNFGGQSTELWTPGGEEAFIQKLIKESKGMPKASLWFSTLVSKEDHLPSLYRALRKACATEVRTINMAQGQKKSRILAWSFSQEPQR